MNKIFQPFLELSQPDKERGWALIKAIVKAHGGVPIAIGIKVVSKEGEGVEFTIDLPA